MSLDMQQGQRMDRLCRTFRRDVIDVLYRRQTGHPGGSLSVCEILTVLYFYAAHVDMKNPQAYDRDRVVLCKGHAAPMLYRVLAEKGAFDKEEMGTLRDLDSRLQGHPCSLYTPGVDMTTGPLGIGLSAALGMALGLSESRNPAHVYAILGDGELNEGAVWEACMAAAKFRADNLTAIVDWNHVQLDGTTEDVMPMGDLEEKFRAFGWHCIVCDGHDVIALSKAYDAALTVQGKPTVILAQTVKGKGVSFMEGKNSWHGKAIDRENYEQAMLELGAAE